MTGLLRADITSLLATAPLVAMSSAAVAAWLASGSLVARPIPPLAMRARSAGAVPGSSATAGEPRRLLGGLRRIPLLVGGSALLAGVAATSGGGPMAGLLILALGAVAHRWLRVRRRAADEAAHRTAVIELCTALVAELRAGRNPRDALAWAASTSEILERQIRPALDYGRDAPVVLREMSARPGGYGLRRLAACWQVAESSGAGLAAAVDRLTNGLRSDEAQRREVSAQLAGARATARLLAGLPLFGLLLAAGLGGDPLRVLLHTPYGMACLGVGAALDAAGLFWTERIASAAERTS